MLAADGVELAQQLAELSFSLVSVAAGFGGFALAPFLDFLHFAVESLDLAEIDLSAELSLRALSYES